MHLRKTLFQPGNEIEKVLERQIGMQSADDVKLRDRFGVAGSCSLESFLESHGVSARRFFFSAESAQTASGHTNIGRIDVAIDVEIGRIAMHSLAHGISQPSHSEDVAAAVKR